MAKLTEAEWQAAAGKAQMELNNLIAYRARQLNEIASLDSEVREISQKIIETEGLLARLQWQRPRGKK